MAPVVGCGGTTSGPAGDGAQTSPEVTASLADDGAGPATLSCEAGTFARTPWSADVEALCLGVPDCTEVRDVLVEGCPNTSICTCGGGHCYGATMTTVDCIGAGPSQCGDRLCAVGQTCSITTVPSATSIGGKKSAFACTP